MYLRVTALYFLGLSLLFMSCPTCTFQVGSVEIGKEGTAALVGGAGVATYFALANLNKQATGVVKSVGFTPTQAQGLTVILTPLFVLQALGFEQLSWAKWLALILAVSKLVQGDPTHVHKGFKRIEYGRLPFVTGLALMAVFTFVQQGKIALNAKAITDFIGMFLATFGTLKAIDFNNFILPFVQYDLIASFIRLYAYLYPIVELAIGGALLSNIKVELATAVAGGLSIVGCVDALSVLMKDKAIAPNHLLTMRVAPPLQVIETIFMALFSWPTLFPSLGR